MEGERVLVKYEFEQHVSEGSNSKEQYANEERLASKRFLMLVKFEIPESGSAQLKNNVHVSEGD